MPPYLLPKLHLSVLHPLAFSTLKGKHALWTKEVGPARRSAGGERQRIKSQAVKWEARWSTAAAAECVSGTTCARALHNQFHRMLHPRTNGKSWSCRKGCWENRSGPEKGKTSVTVFVGVCICTQDRNEGESEGGSTRWEGVYMEKKKGEETFFLSFPVGISFLFFSNVSSLYKTIPIPPRRTPPRCQWCIILPFHGWFSLVDRSGLLKPAVSLKPVHLNSGSAFLSLCTSPLLAPSTQERESACRRHRTGQRSKKGQKEKYRWGRGKGLVVHGSGGSTLEIHMLYNTKTKTKTEWESVFRGGCMRQVCMDGQCLQRNYSKTDCFWNMNLHDDIMKAWSQKDASLRSTQSHKSAKGCLQKKKSDCFFFY